MDTWMEGALALAVVLGLAIGLFLFSGQSLGNGGADSPEPIVIDPEAAARGEALAEGEGCLQCHTIDGRPGSGPTWRGLAGSTRPLTSGEEAVADDAYLFASIVDPHSAIVDGYDDSMPTFYADQLDEQQITDLVEYIKTLAA